jgi:trehalose 6-phosphate synthase/phosphatase
VLEEVVRNTPGSFIEEKMHSLAWHYRMADPVHADRTANELRLHGRETFAPLGLELMSGKRVIEIRRVGVNKGAIVNRILEQQGAGIFSVAVGDDTTDEDMFTAVASSGVTVVVGDRPSKAQVRLRDPAEVRRFLELLVHPSQICA